MFLALLLPIRGALAVVMPMGFGHEPLAASTSTMAQPDAHAAPCPHHDASDAASAQPAPHQHLLCDLCNGSALALSPQGLIDAAIHPGTQVSVLSSFLSASLPGEVKPPIL